MVDAPEPPAPPPQPPQTRSPVWMRLLLVASLGVNLLIVGMVAGAVFSGGGQGPGRDAARDFGNSPFFRALGPDERRQMLGDFRSERRSFREGRKDIGNRFEALLNAIRADEFDAETVTTLLDDQREALLNLQGVGERLLIKLVSEMSVEERRAYADRVGEMVKRRQRR
ncbi:MAG: periplasmic heavy metal sensor [Pseudomonadota bacterium]